MQYAVLLQSGFLLQRGGCGVAGVDVRSSPLARPAQPGRARRWRRLGPGDGGPCCRAGRAGSGPGDRAAAHSPTHTLPHAGESRTSSKPYSLHALLPPCPTSWIGRSHLASIPYSVLPCSFSPSPLASMPSRSCFSIHPFVHRPLPPPDSLTPYLGQQQLTTAAEQGLRLHASATPLDLMRGGAGGLAHAPGAGP